MIGWRTLTPNEVLDQVACLTFEQAAYVLNLGYLRGCSRDLPNPKAVRDLVDNGKLYVLDPDQRPPYLRISSAVVRHYRDTGERMPLRPTVNPVLRGVA